MDKQTVELKNTLLIAGREIRAIEVRKPTIGDEEDAMQRALMLKRGQNPLTNEMLIMSLVANIPYDAIRGMDQEDYMAIRAAMLEMRGEGQSDDSENPLMPGSGSAI